MMEALRFARRLAPALVLLTALAACDDATGPGSDFDATAAADVMESMVATSDGLEDAFASMEAAGTLFQNEGTALLVAGGPTVDADRIQRYVAGPFDPAAAFFPANYLGVTFEYSEAEGHYVPTELEGAPEDGIRIIYYAVDPFTHEPQAEAPLGHIDLRDLSSASSDRLGVEVVNTSGDAPVTLASYTVDVSWTLTETSIGAAVASEGYLSNGQDQLNFDLANTISLSESEVVLTQDYGMDLEGTDLSVAYLGEVVADPSAESGGTLSMTATVTHEGQAVVFDVVATDEALDGTVSYGVGGSSTIVAYIGGTPEAPEFTDAGGNEIDPSELEALQVVFGALSALFELAEGILGPAQ